MAHGAGPTSNGNRVSAGRYWRVRSTNMPYVPPRMCVGGGYYRVAHGAGPTSNGNRVSAGRYWRVRSTNMPYVPPRMCITQWHTGRGRRQTGTGSLPGAGGVSAQPTRPTSRRGCVWGAGITEWHTGRGRRQTGTGSLPGAIGVSAQPTCPTSRRGCVLLSGTRGGANIKPGLGLRRALVACPLNQHTLRPAADMWGAGITEWHTGRGRRQTETGSLSRAGGVSAQPTHPTSRRGCVGGAYY